MSYMVITRIIMMLKSDDRTSLSKTHEKFHDTMHKYSSLQISTFFLETPWSYLPMLICLPVTNVPQFLGIAVKRKIS